MQVLPFRDACVLSVVKHRTKLIFLAPLILSTLFAFAFGPYSIVLLGSSFLSLGTAAVSPFLALLPGSRLLSLLL